MQDDTVIWQIINHSFCSFKASVAKERTFCQNPYNVTGLCLRSACPLANSRYATIREEEGNFSVNLIQYLYYVIVFKGQCYLYMKTIERAHSPKNLWEKIKLPANYAKALEMITEKLEYFPKYLVHRNKQRLTKIHQMIIRMRKLKLQVKPVIVTINTRNEQREKIKERKALQAAELEKSIEIELLERLRQVASESEIYNYPEVQFKSALGQANKSYLKTQNKEEENEEEDEFEDEDEDEEGAVEYVEDFQMSDDEEADQEGDIEDIGESGIEEPLSHESMLSLYKSIEDKRKRKAAGGKNIPGDGKKRVKMEMEYEYEDEDQTVSNTAKLTKQATAYNSSKKNAAATNNAEYNF